MTTQIPHFVDGKRTPGASTRTADVFNPSTGAVQAKVPMAGAADVDAAVASAVEAQKDWAAMESAAPRPGDDAVRRTGQRSHRRAGRADVA